MNTSYEKLSFYNTFFGGAIEGENIVTTDFYGNKEVIGKTIQKYNELLELTNSYYEKLVELGVIEKEKTSEEIAKEQQDLIKAMMIQMQEMQNKIDSLQENIGENYYDEHESDSEFSESKIEPCPTKPVEQINRKSKGNAKFSKQSNGCFG